MAQNINTVPTSETLTDNDYLIGSVGNKLRRVPKSFFAKLLPDGVNSRFNMLQNNDDALSARMDTFTALKEGSTTGDAELQDIRVGADGVTYETAGAAVREQISTQRKITTYQVKSIAAETNKRHFANINLVRANGFSIVVETSQKTVCTLNIIGSNGKYNLGTTIELDGVSKYKIPAGEYVDSLEFINYTEGTTFNVYCEAVPDKEPTNDSVIVNNHMLLVEHEFHGWKYDVNDVGSIRKADGYITTQRIKIGEKRDIYIGNTYTVYIPFFDENGEYISAVEKAFNTPLLKDEIPKNAVYFAFSYLASGLLADKFYTSKSDNAFNKYAYSSIVLNV